MKQLLCTLLLVSLFSSAFGGRQLEQKNCGKGLVCLNNSEWLKAGPLVVIPWLIVFVGSPLAVCSLVFLALGILELTGYISSCCCRQLFSILNGIGAAFWILMLPLTSYMVANGVLEMIAFLVFAAVAAVAHAWVSISYIRRYGGIRNQEQPLQQLLAAQGQGKPYSTDRPAIEEDANPFTLQAALIPGTSKPGYILWLPTEGQPEVREYHTAPYPETSDKKQGPSSKARLVPRP